MLGGAIVVAVVALIAGGRALGVFGPPPAPAKPLAVQKYDVAGETIGTQDLDEGRGHPSTGVKVAYKLDPPTSGDHWGSPAAPAPWGIKDATLPNEVTLHNLEHGGIVVHYKDLSADELSKLRELVRTMLQSGYPKIILQPYPLTDARIAVTAWHWKLKLPGFDDVQIVKFVKSHYQSTEAPEPGVP